MHIKPMCVALVYNQKKEDARQQSLMDDINDPLSLSGAINQTFSHQISTKFSPTYVDDLFAEWDSLETIHAVKSALAKIHEVTLIEANAEAFTKLKRERPDIVFNIAEGLHGVSREAQIPAMLEMLQIPYTGSDPLTLAICLDKARAKEILSSYSIPTPKFSVVSQFSDLSRVSIKYPCIIKPLHEGSSKGIFNSSVVQNRKELRREISFILEKYQEPAIVEEYLEGREFTVALLGNNDNLTILPIIEIKFDSLPSGMNHIYSYEAKWIWDRSDAPLEIFSCPAEIPRRLQKEIEFICSRAFKILKCRDWCRVDVRLDAQGTPHVLELNPLPGILPNPADNSCFPKAARAAGIDYQTLIQSVLKIAAMRYGLITEIASPINQCEGTV